jgi:hypothetical protein
VKAPAECRLFESGKDFIQIAHCDSSQYRLRSRAGLQC